MLSRPQGGVAGEPHIVDVNENVVSAIRGNDEAESTRVVERLDDAQGHSWFRLLRVPNAGHQYRFVAYLQLNRARLIELTCFAGSVGQVKLRAWSPLISVGFRRGNKSGMRLGQIVPRRR
jgi:hypothetical protein